ncbi:patatin-like phospholipase family protein [Halorarius litoreus]|uniref:patatin-like phospholipase family protein n=1 Tax=Halorarius litoreus TaxID=2962676 RepID=UPI0020CC451D|nr:patatin-like phospholipase family protein [Halorarius litoreus]
MSAVTAWYALLDGGPDAVSGALDSLWADLAAREPLDRLGNDWLVGAVRLANTGFPTPDVSPYLSPSARYGQQQLRETLERHVDFSRVPGLFDRDCPDLIVGTVDVEGGVFESFRNEAITCDVLLASAAVPELFPAVRMNGHAHWDGLFSQNPPIHELFADDPKPDELWVVQINPQTIDAEPKSLTEIADRRNELAGNISLNQELRFVETVNDWIDAGHLPTDEYSHTEIRRVQLRRRFSAASKLDRRPAFVEELLAGGHERGRDLLDDAWL